MTDEKILIACIGNLFLGDDAFGVEVARRLAARPLPDGVRVEDFGIRGFDLAYALMDERDATILVDALPHGEAPGTLYVLDPDTDELGDVPEVDGHGMDPVQVLRLVQTMGGQPRGLLVVGCEPAPPVGEDDDFGLSPSVAAAVDEAIDLIETLVARLLGPAPSPLTGEGWGGGDVPRQSGGSEDGAPGWPSPSLSRCDGRGTDHRYESLCSRQLIGEESVRGDSRRHGTREGMTSHHEGGEMKVIGTATLVLSGLVVAGIAYMGWSSLPDLKRYLRMRSM